MVLVEGSEFGTVDYIVFAGLLIISLLIGIVTSMKGNKSPEEFLMGNRSFGPIPIAMSLLTSFVSAISLLGYSGEAYAYGLQMSLFVIGIMLGILGAYFITIPVIFPLKLTSVNEYIELRFKSSRLRKAILGISSVNSMLFMGVCLYAPTIAMSAVTPVSSITYIFILGGVVTVYSSIGGIRAVVWTDVFQLSVMFTGLVIIFIAGLINLGDLTEAYNIAYEGGRLDASNFSLSIYERHTVFNTIAFGLYLYSAIYGVSQINVQRLCSVRSLEDSKKILIINAIGMVIIYVLIFGGGITAYVSYAGCDPLALGIIEKKEEIMPYLIVDKLRFIVGLPGIFVATLIGGALSSLSSVMNSLVAMIWEDVCVEMNIFKNVTPVTAGIINKVFSMIIGGGIIVTALIASTASSLIQFSLSISGVTFGGIYGVFLLGLLFPRTNMKGVCSGITFSCCLVCFISGGSFLYGKSPVPLPLRTDECLNITMNGTRFRDREEYLYGALSNHTSEEEENSLDPDSFLMYFFGISYTLYSVIGTTVCVSVGILVSFLTGNEDLSKVSPKYISPFMRRFYWSKEELNRIENEELKLNVL